MEVYILHCTEVFDGDTVTDTIRVYQSKEKAIEEYNKAVESMEQGEDGRCDTSDIIYQDDENLFIKSYLAYEQGYYSENHINVLLIKREVL